MVTSPESTLTQLTLQIFPLLLEDRGFCVVEYPSLDKNILVHGDFPEGIFKTDDESELLDRITGILEHTADQTAEELPEGANIHLNFSYTRKENIIDKIGHRYAWACYIDYITV